MANQVEFRDIAMSAILEIRLWLMLIHIPNQHTVLIILSGDQLLRLIAFHHIRFPWVDQQLSDFDVGVLVELQLLIDVPNLWIYGV